jgi:hypothetical protein
LLFRPDVVVVVVIVVVFFIVVACGGAGLSEALAEDQLVLQH